MHKNKALFSLHRFATRTSGILFRTFGANLATSAGLDNIVDWALNGLTIVFGKTLARIGEIQTGLCPSLLTGFRSTNDIIFCGHSIPTQTILFRSGFLVHCRRTDGVKPYAILIQEAYLSLHSTSNTVAISFFHLNCHFIQPNIDSSLRHSVREPESWPLNKVVWQKQIFFYPSSKCFPAVSKPFSDSDRSYLGKARLTWRDFWASQAN